MVLDIIHFGIFFAIYWTVLRITSALKIT